MYVVWYIVRVFYHNLIQLLPTRNNCHSNSKSCNLLLPYVPNLRGSFEFQWQIDIKSVNGGEYKTMSSFNAKERWTWNESSVSNDIYAEKLIIDYAKVFLCRSYGESNFMQMINHLIVVFVIFDCRNKTTVSLKRYINNPIHNMFLID